MNYRIPTLIAVLVSICQVAGMSAAASVVASEPRAREVALEDARVPPTRLAYLTPGQSRTYARGIEGWNCAGRGWFSDVQAYHWDGSALGPQEFNPKRQIIFWRSVRGRVTFDGITFRNRTSMPVIVAGWCE
jgi:hypothetical protein